MNREQLIRAIRKLARKQNKHFLLDEGKGKGSHYRIEYGSNWSTVQSEINPRTIQRILKQLEIDPADI